MILKTLKLFVYGKQRACNFSNFYFKNIPKYFLGHSIVPQQQQIDYWKCRISDQLITFIENPDQFIGNTEDSFRDEIIKKINSYSDDSDVVKIAKQQIKKLFISGINLNRKIFSQQRVKDGLSKNNNISFLPTKFSTSLIFKYFKKQANQNFLTNNLLISGSYGFSKTFSCILYSLLTNNVVSFRIKYPKPNSVLQITQSILNRPKVVYWSLDLQKLQLDQFGQFNFIKVLKNNCPQVEQFIKKNQTSFPKWQGKQIQYFNFFEQRNIKLMFNVDQINIIMSIFRKVKYYQSQLQKLKQLKKNQKDIQQIKQIDTKISDCRQKFVTNMKQGTICSKIVNKIKKNYQNFFQNIFLSSIDIDNFQWISMNITGSENHSRMRNAKINYLKKINNPQVLQQIIDFYIFAFGQKVQLNKQQLKNWYKDTNISGQEFLLLRRRLRKSLLNQISKQKGYFYLNLLSINQYFQEKYYNQNNQIVRQRKENQTDYHFNVLNEKLTYHLLQCQNYSIREFNNRVIKFINKDSKTYFPKKILSRIYLKALSKKDNPEDFVQIQIKNFSSSQKQILKQSSIRNIWNELFYYDQSQRKLKVFGCAGFLTKVLQNFSQQLTPFNKENIKEYYQKCTKSGLGINFQLFFDAYTKIKDSKIQFNMSYGTEQFVFYQNKDYSFNSIPKKKNQYQRLDQYSLIEQLKPYFQQLIQKSTQQQKNYTITFYPTKYKKIEIDYGIKAPRDQQSKDIDIIFMKIGSNQKNGKKVIQIWVFDASISEDKSSALKKIKKFLNDYKQTKDNLKNVNQQQIFKYNVLQNEQQFYIQLKYYVVGSNIKQTQDKNKGNLFIIQQLKYLKNVNYIPIQDIKFQFKKEQSLEEWPKFVFYHISQIQQQLKKNKKQQ